MDILALLIWIGGAKAFPGFWAGLLWPIRLGEYLATLTIGKITVSGTLTKEELDAMRNKWRAEFEKIRK